MEDGGWTVDWVGSGFSLATGLAAAAAEKPVFRDTDTAIL